MSIKSNLLINVKLPTIVGILTFMSRMTTTYVYFYVFLFYQQMKVITSGPGLIVYTVESTELCFNL